MLIFPLDGKGSAESRGKPPDGNWNFHRVNFVLSPFDSVLMLEHGGTSRGTLAGFVLTAVPEPSVSLICGFGALGLMLQRRRK